MHEEAQKRMRAALRRAAVAAATAALVALGLVPAAAFGQIFELPRADTSDGDFFGTDVAISGLRVLVGATGEDVCGLDSGAAFVYERAEESRVWALAAELTPSDCEPGHFFGRSVALHENVAVVAATQEFFSRETPNAVYVFEPDSTGEWHETAKLTGGTTKQEGPFGTSVSVYGERILVTASGNQADGTHGGAAYIFSRSEDGGWSLSDRLTASSTRAGVFGTAGAIHGERAVVSASTYFRYEPGSVYFFERRDGAAWIETAHYAGIDDFFISVDMDGRRAIVGESKEGRTNTGAATIFELDASDHWERKHTILLDRPYDHGAFGTDVAIDGDYALIAAYDEQLGLDFNVDRVVYVFKRSPQGEWHRHQILDVGEVAFGASIDIDNGYAAVGSASDGAPGAVYVVRLVD